MNRNERLRRQKLRSLEIVSGRIKLMGRGQVMDSSVVVRCAHIDCDVKDPDKLELYLQDESKRPLTRSGKRKWGTNLYPGIATGHIDPSPFMVLFAMRVR